MKMNNLPSVGFSKLMFRQVEKYLLDSHMSITTPRTPLSVSIADRCASGVLELRAGVIGCCIFIYIERKNNLDIILTLSDVRCIRYENNVCFAPRLHESFKRASIHILTGVECDLIEKVLETYEYADFQSKPIIGYIKENALL